MAASRVFVVQQRFTRQQDGSQRFHDYTPAERFGTIVYLVPPKSMVDELYGGDIEKLLKDRLSDFGPDDHLILSGDPVLCAQCVLWAVSKLDEQVEALSILKWRHDVNDYEITRIPIPY